MRGSGSYNRNFSLNANPLQKPVGGMKKLVTIVERGGLDDFLYPADSKSTLVQPCYQQYHQFASEVLETNYTGHAQWGSGLTTVNGAGSRITFTVPVSEHADLLQWCCLVLQPGTWIPSSVIPGLLRDDAHAFVPQNPNSCWTWIDQLGQHAIEKAELEAGGLVIDTVDGDWANICSLAFLTSQQRAGWTDSIVGGSITGTATRQQLIQPTEDGNIYLWLPFWFARRKNTGFPLASLQNQPLRIHITLRKFTDVVRMVGMPRSTCDSSPLGTIVSYTDESLPHTNTSTWTNLATVPALANAQMIFGVTYLADELRYAYRFHPHEIMVEQTIRMHFAEPLKYAVGPATANSIQIALPLTSFNNPVRRIFFFVRRKAIFRYNEWSNYGSRLQDEIDPVWSPQKPLLRHAKLLVGTVFLIDQPEVWWRSNSATSLPGGVQLYDNYIYSCSFDGDSDQFAPHGGTLNSSRIDLRLDLEIDPPLSAEGISVEWEVVVFGTVYNWLRFQNGIANLLFTD